MHPFVACRLASTLNLFYTKAATPDDEFVQIGLTGYGFLDDTPPADITRQSTLLNVRQFSGRWSEARRLKVLRGWMVTSECHGPGWMVTSGHHGPGWMVTSGHHGPGWMVTSGHHWFTLRRSRLTLPAASAQPPCEPL